MNSARSPRTRRPSCLAMMFASLVVAFPSCAASRVAAAEAPASPAGPPTWYVSPAGNDAWSGRLPAANEAGTDGPMASVMAAVAASRQVPDQPRRIVLAEGRYFIESPVTLDPRDSRLAIEGAGPGKTILYGGRRLTGWQPDGEHLWCAALPDDLPEWSFRVLVVNDAIQDRARVPESGYLEHETKFDVRWMSTAGGGWERPPTDAERTTMRYKPGDVPADLSVANAEVTICHMWDESTVGVAAHDPATRTLTFSSPCGHPPGAFNVPRYAIWNTREGTTRPGQWYLDRAARKVFYWAREGEDMTQAQVVAPRVETIVRMVGKSDARIAEASLRGLTLSATDAPLKPAGFGASNWPAAIEISRGERVRIEEVEVGHAGGWGVRESNGRELVVRGCALHHLGGGGVRFGDAALIEGNSIRNIGLANASAIGIMGGGTGGVVRRNVVHDTPYSGMCLGGTETLVEENLLYRCMLVHHDGAAIYVSGGQRCIVRRNLARDMAETGPGYGVSAYYLDEKCQECVVAENVSINIERPTHNHMTLNCELRDNVFLFDGDMTLSFARCAGHKVTNNTLHLSGKLRVNEPDAVVQWSGNRLFVRDEAGGRILDEIPAAPFIPRDKPRYHKVPFIAHPPTIDGVLGPDEWPSGGTALTERANQRSVRGAPTSVKIHADREHLYLAANVVAMFPGQRRLGTEWGNDEGIELVLQAQENGQPVVHVLRGFTDGTLTPLTVAGASGDQADAFAKTVRYGASVDKQLWRCEWSVPLAALGVAPHQKTVLPFNLTVYRSEDNVFASFAGTLGESWELDRGGRLMLPGDDAPPTAEKR